MGERVNHPGVVTVEGGDSGVSAHAMLRTRKEPTMPLLDLLLAMFWFFLFFMWIYLVITVFIDIFRSDDMGGFAKAMWVLFVIIILLTWGATSASRRFVYYGGEG